MPPCETQIYFPGFTVGYIGCKTKKVQVGDSAPCRNLLGRGGASAESMKTRAPDSAAALKPKVDRRSRTDTNELQRIERAQDSSAAAIEHVRIDHSRAHVLVPQQLLHRANVITILQQVGRERVTQYVRAHWLGYARALCREGD